jgi:hypothetical protein
MYRQKGEKAQKQDSLMPNTSYPRHHIPDLPQHLPLSPDRFCAIRTAIAPLDQCSQLALDKLLAKGRDTVYEHLSVEMIKLMLHHPGKISLNPFVMMLKLLIVPLHMNTSRTNHLLVNGRQREASLF